MTIDTFRVAVMGPMGLNVEAFATEANLTQSSIKFQQERKQGGGLLVVVDTPQDYLVETKGPVLTLSLHDAQPMANYARITLVEYAMIGVYTGLLVSRLRKSAPLLTREDQFHTSHLPCLLSHAGRLPDIGHLMESLHICPRCRRFYTELGAALEINALISLLDKIEENRISRSLRRRRQAS